jgi:hypothetical protein
MARCRRICSPDSRCCPCDASGDDWPLPEAAQEDRARRASRTPARRVRCCSMRALRPSLQYRRRNLPCGNSGWPGNRHTGRRSGAYCGLVCFGHPVDVAYLRNPAPSPARTTSSARGNPKRDEPATFRGGRHLRQQAAIVLLPGAAPALFPKPARCILSETENGIRVS